MTPEEEIEAVGEVVQAAHDNADVHLKRAEKELHLEGARLAHYRDFLVSSALNARSVLEQAIGPVRPVRPGGPGSAPAPTAPAPTPQLGGRSCSFCGNTDAETKLVAGPAGNICEPCTRLACGVLGIELSH